MAEQVNEVDFGGFFYTFDYMAKLDEELAKLKEKAKAINKQKKDAMAQLMRQGLQIVETAKAERVVTGQVKLDDFMGNKHSIQQSRKDDDEDEGDE